MRACVFALCLAVSGCATSAGGGGYYAFAVDGGRADGGGHDAGIGAAADAEPDALAGPDNGLPAEWPNPPNWYMGSTQSKCFSDGICGTWAGGNVKCWDRWFDGYKPGVGMVATCLACCRDEAGTDCWLQFCK